VRTPTIHLNGTSRAALLDAYTEASAAVRHAIAAVQNAHPNARDYYPQGDSATGEAMAEHMERLRKLQAVREELYTIAEAITEAP